MMLVLESPLELVLQIVIFVEVMLVILASLEMKYCFELNYDLVHFGNEHYVKTVYRYREKVKRKIYTMRIFLMDF